MPQRPLASSLSEISEIVEELEENQASFQVAYPPPSIAIGLRDTDSCCRIPAPQKLLAGSVIYESGTYVRKTHRKGLIGIHMHICQHGNSFMYIAFTWRSEVAEGGGVILVSHH